MVGRKIKSKILPQAFFEKPTLEVAEKLLGKFLVRHYRGREQAYMITEVEAYDGFSDKASHAHKGKTVRTEIMFGEAGYWYVYLVYGMHHMLNVVTGKKEYPAAVLIRSVKGVSGPGRLTKELSVGKLLNTRKVSKESGLWIEDRGVKVEKKDIKKTPRIGVSYAGPVWSNKHYRFVLK
jgi:DNA-3-methyladenine glycosylase|tara:strand:- start:93157 stop:93693 length:537 start_codon:yes stop_codon:yes gene_type:complete